MCQRLIVLQGGENVAERANQDLFRKIRKLSDRGRMLIIPWTSDSREKENRYRIIFKDYFTESGFDSVSFLEKDDSPLEIRSKMSSVDVLYLPGGDTDILYREIGKHSLEDNIRDFCGIIVGNSAGAIVLSRGAVGNGKFHPGFGIVDVFIRVHYNFEENDVKLDEEIPMISIPENTWITVSPSRKS